MPARLRDPVTWTNTLQVLKTALAAVIAWVLAKHVFDISQPFLAPWAALLTVHATVFGTFKRGAQQVGATVLGVLIASGAGHLFGVSALALGVAVLLALLAGSIRGLRSEATTAAATAIVVLTTGYSDDGSMLAARLLDTGIGIAVGMVVNLAVWPPLRDRGAAHLIDRIDDRTGELLSAIAATVRSDPDTEAWIERADALDHEIDEAWRVLGQARESGRLNPRRSTRARMRAAKDFGGVLERLELAVAETRSMIRSIALARVPPQDWDPGFREPWIDLLHRAGTAVSAADVAGLVAVRAGLDDLAGEPLPPIYGALLVNLRNIIEALDVVADAQPVRVPVTATAPRT